jgi:hypothetical protein
MIEKLKVCDSFDVPNLGQKTPSKRNFNFDNAFIFSEIKIGLFGNQLPKSPIYFVLKNIRRLYLVAVFSQTLFY